MRGRFEQILACFRMGGCGCGPHQVSKILCNICSSGSRDLSWGMWIGVGTYVNMILERYFSRNQTKWSMNGQAGTDEVEELQAKSH